MELAFGEALRHARRAASLSQQELADRAGVTVNGISQLERGVRTRPYPHTVRALADALDLVGPDRARFLAAAPPRGPVASLPAQPSGVPSLGRQLVGRDGDVTRALAAVADGRIVTLTGPGGVGKTSLAVTVAGHVAREARRTVTFVPLADVDDTEVALLTIGRRAGLQDTGATDVRVQLRAALDGAARLLVLDNLEQLPDLTVEVAALLADVPRLAVLATSRGPLRSRVELELPVRPLEPRTAVDLLLDRATTAPAPLGPPALDEDTTAVLARICERVDGLPLAVELAAGWLRILTPVELADRLEDALPMLVDGPADLPERHRTMRDTIAWSERLLDDDQRDLFHALATLPGGWDLATAAAVADRPESEVLRGVALLVERSLVTRTDDGADGQARYRMLETVRAYGRERSAAAGDHLAAEERLADVVVDLVAQVWRGGNGPDQAAWLARAEERLPDVRAVLRWALRTGRPGTAGRIHASLLWFWYLRHVTEGERWGREILAATAHLDDATRGRVESTLALTLFASGDRRGALTLAERAAQRATAVDDAEGLARALAVLGNAAANATEREVLDRVTGQVGQLDPGVDFVLAARASIRIAEARMAQATGDVHGAERLLGVADQEVEQAAMPWLRSLWLNVAAGVGLQLGRADDVLPRLRRSLAISAELGDAPATMYAVTLLGLEARRLGRHEVAACVLAAADVHGVRTGQRITDPATVQLLAAVTDSLEDELGVSRYGQAVDAGRRLSPAGALELVDADVGVAPG